MLGLLVGVSAAHADYVPLQRTPAGTAARLGDARLALAEVGLVLGVPPEQIEATTVCSSFAADVERRDVGRLGACATALGAVYGTLTDGPDVDSRRAGAKTYVASEVADAAFRVTAARARLERGGLVAPGAVGAQILVPADGRTLRIRPLQALRPGRAWSLVVEGLSPEARDAARATAVPRPGPGGLVVPEGSFVAPIVAEMKRGPTSVNYPMAIEVTRQMEADLRGRSGTSPVAGVQIQLPAPLEPADLTRIVAHFVPARHAGAEDEIVTLRVANLRFDLMGARARIRELGCPSRRPERRGGLERALGEAGALIVEGTYPSLDLRREEKGRLRELPVVDASVVELPYLLATPPNLRPDTPLVLLVHGHGGKARKFLAKHARPLVARGLAVVSVEIPEHGDRGAREREFLGIQDPARFRVNYRQSVVDILALLRTAADCGFRLPTGDYRPTDFRYLGYSLGGLLGIAVRSVSPELGPAVFLAAAGDLAGWLRLHFVTDLNAPVVTCLGGAQHGRNCLEDRTCAAPGVCWVDPFLAQMAALIDMPIGLVLADAEPLGPARVRTGAASHGPVLLLTGGSDGVLFPLLQARLADAYDMRGEHPERTRGPRSERRHWPELGHDLIESDAVRSTAYDFLAASRGSQAGAWANHSVDNQPAGR